MEAQIGIAILLLIGGVIAYVRPQWISTLNGLPPEKLRHVDLPKVRREAGGGLTLLAILIGTGSWALAKAGVEQMVISVIRIILIFVGAIVIMVRVERHNHNK